MMRKSFVKQSKEDIVFSIITYTLAVFALILTLYPLIYAVSASFSSPSEVMSGNVWLFPEDFTTSAYQAVVKDNRIITGYMNTIFYTIVGTTINIILTIIGAYPLSKKDFYGRKLLTILFTITMFFSGGMIPMFLLVKELSMYNSFWSLLIPGALSMWNLIIMRNFFEHSISEEICEAAYIDGCSNVGTLIKIVLPLSKAILAVMVIFYAVDHWNAYFDALLYLKDRSKYPLSLVLREILLMGVGADKTGGEVIDSVNDLLLFETLKYAVIIVSSLPMLVLYPIMQKHFVKGIMVGAVKG